MDQYSTIGISGLRWKNESEVPEVPFWVQGCVDIDYDSELHVRHFFFLKAFEFVVCIDFFVLFRSIFIFPF